MTLCAQSHPGRTDAEGCHAGKLPRHCHGSDTGRDTPAKDANRSAARKTASEDDYNRSFCASVGGVTETRHNYTYNGGSSFVKVDCETDTTVYEGGTGQAQQPGQRAAGAVFQCADRQGASGGDL